MGGVCRSGQAASEVVLPHAHASEKLARVGVLAGGIGWRRELGRGIAGEKGEIEKISAR